MKQRKWKNIILVFAVFLCIGIGISQIELKSVNTYQQEQKELAEQMVTELTEDRKEAEQENQGMETPTSNRLLSSEKGGDKNQTGEKGKSKKEESSENETKARIEKKNGKNQQTVKEKNSQNKTVKKEEQEKDNKKEKKVKKKAETTKKPSTKKENMAASTSTPLVSQTEYANTLEETGKEETMVPVIVTETPTTNPVTVTKEPDSTEVPKTLTCEIEINCTVLLDNMDKVEEGTKSYVPASGMILDKKEVKVEEGDTVYDMLSKVCKANNIHLDAEYSKMYSSSYIKGIGYIYEKCAGTRSGWVYLVNGKSPNKGASQYTLSDGDEVSWVYTCTGKAGS